VLLNDSLVYVLVEVARLIESEVGRIGLRKCRSVAVRAGNLNSLVTFDGPQFTRPVRTAVLRRADVEFTDFVLVNWECVVTGKTVWFTGEDRPVARRFYPSPRPAIDSSEVF
jgi:hypothetical protein